MKHRILFKCIVGSQAYGTNVEGSDTDIKGVYIQSHADILTFKYEPQIEVNKDEVYYEVRRFIELLQSANPTVLEMLYTPDDCVLQSSPEFQLIIDMRSEFITKKCKNSFGGYAVQQIRKAQGLQKKMNWEEAAVARKTPLDFCFVYENGKSENLANYLKRRKLDQSLCGLSNVDHIRDGYALHYDWRFASGINDEPIGLKGIVLEDSNSIRVSEVPKNAGIPYAFVHYNKDGYSQSCNKFKEYQTWLTNRNIQRYVDIEEHNQRIDGKNMLHCSRLLDTAIEIATKGTVNVRRPNAEYLISIRKGKVNLTSLLLEAENRIKCLDKAFEKSVLPQEVSKEACNQLLLTIRYLQPQT